MNQHYLLGLLIIILGGIANGCFALPMKYSRAWRWENNWLIFSLFALLVFPWTLAMVFVPQLGALYHHAPLRLLMFPLTFGFFWGFAQVTFGISIDAIGMAIAFAVVQGVQTPLGSIIPLLALGIAALFQPRGVMMLVSLPILLLGLYLYGVAGRRRETEQKSSAAAKSGAAMSFSLGLALAIFTGVFGANLNLGFAFAGGLVTRSAQLGANPAAATYPVWALVLAAGFIPNLLYCGFLLFRNRTWGLFAAAGCAKETALALAMGVLWLGGITLYGIGANLVGTYGTSVGFVLMTATVMLTANVVGVFSGEWKLASSRTKRLLAAGMATVLASVIVLNLGGLFGSH